MVLKVVMGKIFETLELQFLPLPCSSVLELQEHWESAFAFPVMVGLSRSVFGWDCSHVKLSKNADYLIDNLGTPILSELKE